MPRRRVRTPVEQFQPFERGRIAGLREAWWTYRRIAAHVGYNVSMLCRCFQQWSVEHSHTCKPGSGWLRSTDARQHRRIVREAMVSRTSPREEIRAHVAPAVSSRTIGNSLLAAGLRSRVPLATLPLIPQHLQARLPWCRERVDWRVEWRSVVFRDDKIRYRVSPATY